MDSYDIKIVLCVEGIDLRTGGTYYLSLNKAELEMPQRDMKHKISINQSLFEIIYSHIGLDVNWMSPKLSSVYNESNVVYLIYKSIIPHDTELKNAYWLPIQQSISNPLISNIAQST